jgi:hypothetical protein
MCLEWIESQSCLRMGKAIVGHHGPMQNSVFFKQSADKGRMGVKNVISIVILTDLGPFVR